MSRGNNSVASSAEWLGVKRAPMQCLLSHACCLIDHTHAIHSSFATPYFSLWTSRLYSTHLYT